ncbi:MAG: HNH endonuclease [SAR324 cluster bacterium]|nr:HNH endonuclease [SAR324 cluster bacterium]
MFQFTHQWSELIQRLDSNECEYCGKQKGYFEIDHIRKLSDVKEGKTAWQKLMSARKRKTLVLCVECHDLLHAGKLPDWRNDNHAKMKSRMY